MPFTVVYSSKALDQLANAWMKALDKNALANAANGLERALKNDHLKAGRHLSEGLWIAQWPPLLAYFEVSADDRLVTITDFEILE